MPAAPPKPSLMNRLFGQKPKPVEEDVFVPDFLAQIERLRIATLKALGGGLREGHRLGAYKGGQLEFHGHRDYSPGDELRYLDWNGYARLGRPFIKEFAREESGVLHILLDATASMRLGQPSKFTFARRVAALFAHVALSSQDVVLAGVFKSSGQNEFFPARGARTLPRDFLTFFQRIQAEEFELNRASGTPIPPHSSLAGWTADFLKRSPKRGGVILISDFWHEEQDIATAVSLLTQSGFDASAIHTLATEELDPGLSSGAPGEALVRAVESGAELPLWFGPDVAALYSSELEKHRASIEAIFRKRGGQYLFTPSDTPLEKVLLASLRQRRWLA